MDIHGTTAVETLNGTSGDDTFYLEGGTDTVNGNGGMDEVNLNDAAGPVTVNLATGLLTGWGTATLNGISQIYGGWHGGVLTGNANTTYIAAPGGDTTIYAGGTSGVTIVLGYGDDTVHGGPGNDTIFVFTGNNVIDGGGGYNTVDYSAVTQTSTVSGFVTVDLYAGAWHPGGYDSLTDITNITGGNYGNILKGDWQNNIIVGGSGNDIIDGRQGNDVLTGGAGADLFIMDAGTGNTVVTDFSAAQGDQIDLSAYGFHTLAGILAVASQSGADTVITLGSGSVTLKGVAESSLAAADFANLVPETIGYQSSVRTAVFSGAAGSYSINVSGDTVTVGADTLTYIQQAQFSDYMLVFDLNSSQDKLVYELYQAAYDRTPDNAGFRYWAQAADNTGMSATALADQFLSAAEFTQKYGANPTNTAYVTELYTNVLGRAPDQAGLNYWIGEANGGMAHDQLLVAFATSAENLQLIGAHTSAGFWTTM